MKKIQTVSELLADIRERLSMGHDHTVPDVVDDWNSVSIENDAWYDIYDLLERISARSISVGDVTGLIKRP